MEKPKVPSKADFYTHLDSEVTDYGAESETHNMDEKENLLDHDHSFVIKTGNVAECSCSWGIYLDDKDEFRDGHIYRDGTLII